MNAIIIIVPVMLLIYLVLRFRSFPLYLRGMKAYGAGDASRALKLLKNSVEAGLSAKHQLTVGYLLLKEGYPEDAERIFTFLIHNPQGKFNNQHARAYSALIHWKMGRLDDAVEELENLLKENYRSSALYCNLGFFLIEQGNMNRALEVNLEAVNYDEESPVIQDNLGLCYIKNEDWIQAQRVYDKLIATEPSFPDAWYNAAQVALHEGEKEKAESLLKTALVKKFSYLSTLSKVEVEELLNSLTSS